MPDPVVEFKRALMRAMRQQIRASFKNRAEAGTYLGLVQTAVTSICTIKHHRYSIEWLLNVAHRLGMKVEFLPPAEIEAGSSIRRRRSVAKIRTTLGELPELTLS